MKTNALRVILAGGLIAGTIDIAQAFFFFGHRVPLGISAALIGQAAERAGPLVPVYILGLVLHYCIATTWTAAYYLASRKLTFMTEYPVMNVSLLLGMSVHMVTIGLPIAFTVRWLGKETH